MENQNEMNNEPRKRSNGSIITVIIAIVVILVIIILLQPKNNQEEVYIPENDQTVEELSNVSASDEVDSIELDILNTDLENLDEGL